MNKSIGVGVSKNTRAFTTVKVSDSKEQNNPIIEVQELLDDEYNDFDEMDAFNPPRMTMNILD